MISMQLTSLSRPRKEKKMLPYKEQNKLNGLLLKQNQTTYYKYTIKKTKQRNHNLCGLSAPSLTRYKNYLLSNRRLTISPQS